MKAVRNEKIIFSRKSLAHKYSSKSLKYASSAYGHMFLEDMCFDFAITFSSFSKTENFFSFTPHDSKIIELLEYRTPSFLQYDFSTLLSDNMNLLMLDGSCYVEIELGVEDAKLKSISFIPMHASRSITMRNKIKFYSTNYKDERVNWTIPKNLIIKHDLRDLGVKRNHFQSILKGLSEKGLPDFMWTSENGIPFEDYNNKQVLDMFKIVGHTYWNLRKPSSEYINDIYLLYRKVMFDEYRLQFLEYLLSNYNKALAELGLEYGFTGEIICNVDISNHKIKLEQLLSGEINCEEMANYLFTHKK